MTKQYFAVSLIAAALSCALVPGMSSAQDQQKQMSAAEYRAQLDKDVPATIARFQKVDPGIEKFFKSSAGYVVFPRIGKFGFIVAGGHGTGLVFEKGNMIGSATMTIATIGLQAGIQDYAEIIFFENQAALDRFKQNKFEFSAGASAVVLAAGASKNANYRDGVAVFAQSNSGAMVELSVGTQKFSFKPEGAAAKK